MYNHPLILSESPGMTKQALFQFLLPAAAVTGKILGALGTVAGAAWLYNELRRAWSGPAAVHNVKVFPTVDVTQQFKEQLQKNLMAQQQQNYGGGFSLPGGYTLPGLAAGALLGGLIGRNATGALIGGLTGGGLGYLANRFLSPQMGAPMPAQTPVQANTPPLPQPKV